MNFDLSKEQEMIVASVAGFVKDESPVERFRELRGTDQGWDPRVWKEMGDYGWLGIAFPEEYGGIDGSFIDMALILEQLGRGLVPEPYIASVVLAGWLVFERGSDEQKNAWLRPMIEGDISLALAYVEAGSRYDLARVGTSATAAGDGTYKLTGQKTWVLNGHAANGIVVSARTGGEAGTEDGVSLFLVEGDAAGLERTPVNGMDGHKTAFLQFADTPATLLGGEGDAFEDLCWAIDRGAAAACAEGQGHLQEMFERTIEYLKQREQFGVKIGTFQALQHKAADMFAETELCRGTMILAALQAEVEDRTERETEISAAKLQLTDGGWLVQENCIQLHGGIGITDEADVGLFFKRLRVLQGLFGDADYHVGRVADAPTFAAV